MVSDTLYLGADVPQGGTVSADDWRTFLEDTATPRFPQGLSWWPAQGQWKGANGDVVRESSHVLRLVHGGSFAEQQATQEIAAAYKARFRQEAVLRTRTAACVSF